MYKQQRDGCLFGAGSCMLPLFLWQWKGFTSHDDFFVNASVSDKITGRRTIKQHTRGKNEQFASHGTKCSVASLNSQIFKITQRRHLEFVGKKPQVHLKNMFSH